MAKGSDWRRVRGEKLIKERGHDAVEDPILDRKGRPRGMSGAGTGNCGGKTTRLKGSAQIWAEEYDPNNASVRVIRAGDPSIGALGKSSIGERNGKFRGKTKHKKRRKKAKMAKVLR